jgi:hypothetical protein
VEKSNRCFAAFRLCRGFEREIGDRRASTSSAEAAGRERRKLESVFIYICSQNRPEQSDRRSLGLQTSKIKQLSTGNSIDLNMNKTLRLPLTFLGRGTLLKTKTGAIQGLVSRGLFSQDNGTTNTVNDEEVAKFSRMASSWWDPHGPFELLHKMNPTRVSYIRHQVEIWKQKNAPIDEASSPRSSQQTPSPPAATNPFPFQGLDMLDIGCGGGLLSEVR